MYNKIAAKMEKVTMDIKKMIPESVFVSLASLQEAWHNSNAKQERQNQNIVLNTLASYGLTVDDVTHVMTVNYWEGSKGGLFTCLICTNVVEDGEIYPLQIPTPLMLENINKGQYYEKGGIFPTAKALGLPVLEITNAYHEQRMAFNPRHFEVFEVQYQDIDGTQMRTDLVSASGMTHGVVGTVEDIMTILGKTYAVDTVPEYDSRRGLRKISDPRPTLSHALDAA